MGGRCMKVGDLVKQKKTLCGGPGPVLLVTSISRDGEYARVLFMEKRWLFRTESLEVLNASR